LQDNQKENIVVNVAMLIIVIIGTWLRLRNLSTESIWLDEAVSWAQAKGSFAQMKSMTAHGIQSPLHNLILFAFIHGSASDSEWILRAPSALMGIGNIVAIYWLGVLIGGRTTGALAAVILAMSGFHIYYAHEARMYTLLALTATLYAAVVLPLKSGPT
jgi:mannosyltransferase